MSNKRTRNKQVEQEVVLTVFTNNMQDESAYQTLQLFYKGALANEIGLMRAMNSVTNEEELLLVGIERNGDSMDAYPLARILDAAEIVKYQSPDGMGGYHGV